MQYFGENGIIKKTQQAKEMYNNTISAGDEASDEFLAEYENMMVEEDIEPSGDVLVNDTTYYSTLAEALTYVANNDVIKFMRDANYEGESISIDKNITIDINDKNITVSQLRVSSEKTIIIGNGTINLTGTGISNGIVSNGDLEINDVKIFYVGNSYAISNNGTVTINSGEIYGEVYCSSNININGGKIDRIISATGNANINMTDGEIETIDFSSGGTMVITGGKVITSFELGNSRNDIDITIGDVNAVINSSNPIITNINMPAGEVAGITCNIKFYNGIIIHDSDELVEELEMGCAEVTVRSGYSIGITQNASTGKYEYTLQK